ncbi:MAG: hypothetical protein QOE51_1490 [Actinoplanes sp.]|jgi:hypothetical protein|nr:hypothetical protein [Actinoplanes sp.]
MTLDVASGHLIAGQAAVISVWRRSAVVPEEIAWLARQTGDPYP